MMNILHDFIILVLYAVFFQTQYWYMQYNLFTIYAISWYFKTWSISVWDICYYRYYVQPAELVSKVYLAHLPLHTNWMLLIIWWPNFFICVLLTVWTVSYYFEVVPINEVVSSYCGYIFFTYYFSMDEHVFPGQIPGLHPANERRRYFVTTSLIGWVQT